MLWLKALHIIFVVCWFAGLFYLPRLLVNYAASDSPATRQTLAQMAHRLYRFVTPFMYLVFVFGFAIYAMNPGYYHQAGWMWAKLAGVACLFVYHLQCGRYVRAINNDQDEHSHVFYRFFNEIPVLFLFGIVLLAVLKPF